MEGNNILMLNLLHKLSTAQTLLYNMKDNIQVIQSPVSQELLPNLNLLIHRFKHNIFLKLDDSLWSTIQ